MKTRINRRRQSKIRICGKQPLQKGSVSKIHIRYKKCKNDKHVWWPFIFLMQPTLIKAIDCVTDEIELLF